MTELDHRITGEDTSDPWSVLLDELQCYYADTPALQGFCPFPDDLTPGDRIAHHLPCSDLLASDTKLQSLRHPNLHHAMVAVRSQAQWRDTYAGTPVGGDFRTRFGCYSIVGRGGQWVSAQMACYLVYMPPYLDYPLHEHPAEELYCILAGRAEFWTRDEPVHEVAEGGTVFHPSGVPHGTRTGSDSLLALVVWRNHLMTPPVWSEGALQ